MGVKCLTQLPLENENRANTTVKVQSESFKVPTISIMTDLSD